MTSAGVEPTSPRSQSGALNHHTTEDFESRITNYPT